MLLFLLFLGVVFVLALCACIYAIRPPEDLQVTATNADGTTRLLTVVQQEARADEVDEAA